MKFIKKNYPFIIFSVVYFIALAYKIIFKPTPFFDWDESLYVQTGKEMLIHKYFLAPVWQGVPWLDKPPMVPLIYGLVMKIFFFMPAEISTRLFTLFIALIVLFLLYKIYFKVLKESWLATVAVTATAFIPIFFQRVQVVNLDLYLLLGWLGTIAYFDNFALSTLFLFIAVMSKSLIGFYPIAMIFVYNFYLLIIKKIDRKKFFQLMKKISIQTFICSLWFILMLFIYKQQFFKQHIIESHFRRVTSSIEFHFGQRTYYLDLALQQTGLLSIVAALGLLLIVVQFFRKKIKTEDLFYSLYLLPWFIFLNLTKTKIFWYFFACAPQIAFLSVYPISVIRKRKVIYYLLTFIMLFFILWSVVKNNVYNTVYSKYEDYYYLSLYAKNRCSDLSVLLNAENRKAFDTLDKMGLLITTTKWWGNHPSMVYYFGKKVNYLYDLQSLTNSIANSERGNCYVIEKEDNNKQFENLRLIKQFDRYLLYSRSQSPTQQ